MCNLSWTVENSTSVNNVYTTLIKKNVFYRQMFRGNSGGLVGDCTVTLQEILQCALKRGSGALTALESLTIHQMSSYLVFMVSSLLYCKIAKVI